MSGNRKLLVAFVSAIVAISVVGAMQWHYVGAAQSRYFAEVSRAYASIFSLPQKLANDPTHNPFQSPILDLGSMPSRQAELALTKNAMAVLSTLTIFAGCFAVAYYSRNPWPSVAVAVVGWLVTGTVAAALTSQAVKMLADMPQSFSGGLITWHKPGAGGPPFALYVVIGLFSALLFQGFVPWIAGWFAGSRISSWRASVLDFSVGGDALSPAAVPSSDRRRCQCGAVNLPAAATCYACGAVFETTGPAAADGS